MLAVFEHVPDDTVVWANDKRVCEVLKAEGVGSEVRMCGEDGWPDYYDRNTLFVRLTNTPPPVPVSLFEKGEIVVSESQLGIEGEMTC